MNMRRVFGFVALALGLLALFAVLRPAAAPQVEAARAFTSSEQCRACHTEIYAEWETSWHAQSWSDPEVRALSNDFSNADCIDCHAPRPVFETGIGVRVLPRNSRRGEGVDCIVAAHVARGHDGPPPFWCANKGRFPGALVTPGFTSSVLIGCSGLLREVAWSARRQPLRQCLAAPTRPMPRRRLHD